MTTEHVPSKEPSLQELMRWLRHRHVVLVEQGANDSYEGFIHAHIESLQRQLARPAYEREPPHCSTCSCGMSITSSTVEITAEQRQMLTARGVGEIPGGAHEPCAECRRLREGLQLIATDEHRLMNIAARQTAESILSGKPSGVAAQPPGDGQ